MKLNGIMRTITHRLLKVNRQEVHILLTVNVITVSYRQKEFTLN